MLDAKPACVAVFPHPYILEWLENFLLQDQLSVHSYFGIRSTTTSTDNNNDDDNGEFIERFQRLKYFTT